MKSSERKISHVKNAKHTHALTLGQTIMDNRRKLTRFTNDRHLSSTF
jgi:hypothetical protein